MQRLATRDEFGWEWDPDAMAPAIVQPVTRALAELQTTIVSEGVRAFDGWLERFVVYTLIARLSGLTDPQVATPISANALAASLGQPYETVRRHVNALTADGLCVRDRVRLRVAPEGLARPHIDRLIRVTHDSFVRFVEHLAAAGEALPARRAGDYQPSCGNQAAADILLAVLQTNREKHAGWLDLVLFSTVVAGNCRVHPIGPTPCTAAAPVTAAAVARTIGIGQPTVNRHLQGMAVTGQLRRTGNGYLVNPAWLHQPAARAVTELSLHNVRRLFGAAAANAFPFDDPASAYLDARPPLTPIG